MPATPYELFGSKNLERRDDGIGAENGHRADVT